MAKYTLGVDYGTNSVRALVVDTSNGAEIGTSVWNYETGDAGVHEDHHDVHLARQNPADYLKGFVESVKGAIADAKKTAGFDVSQIVGIGVDTTGSTPIPVDADGVALALKPEFKGNLHAMAWLWKDHTGYAEAAEITQKAQSFPYLKKCGGTYSSEWFWSKILRCKRVAPDVFAAAHSWVELQDYVPAWLVGKSKPSDVPRGICAAGHKAMYHTEWGGLPSKEFLSQLDPDLASLRDRLYETTLTADQVAGQLLDEHAQATGLPAGIPVAVGAFDAHLGAVGSGIREGTIVKIMGTSTCDIMIGGSDTPDIPGVCGIVPGSVVPGFMGIEAGQSAVGDLFNWCVEHLGNGSHDSLTDEADDLKPGESGLLALDWNNGNRTILVDPLLTGLIVGQTLHTTAGEIYRALIEATAYGSRKIIERIEEYGVAVKEVVVCGGIGEKSPLTMQIYSDVLGRPIRISRSAQTCALGSAVMASVAAGVHGSVLEAAEVMTGYKDVVYQPRTDGVAVYNRLYELYSLLHDSFGVAGHTADLSRVMKDLLEIRREVVG
ncbi:MAG: ribulokinase [Armatimonadetes bacterium]|nr:ribulokinase [Armatimonadota bacterium]